MTEAETYPVRAGPAKKLPKWWDEISRAVFSSWKLKFWHVIRMCIPSMPKTEPFGFLFFVDIFFKIQIPEVTYIGIAHEKKKKNPQGSVLGTLVIHMRITCQNFNFQLEKNAREIAFHHFGSFLAGPARRVGYLQQWKGWRYFLPGKSAKMAIFCFVLSNTLCL